ncbi:hypothetical protein [Azorhizobium oxalatiphilum]|nr:hypothetical protein [Azorhizobium oxalatiphilum]
MHEAAGDQAGAVAQLLNIGQAMQWRPISEAKKDGTTIWAKLRDDIYPGLLPTRDDLERWNGIQMPMRHNGLAADGFDIGWGVAAPVGCGGFPDEWIEGWMPLPSPPQGDEGGANG